MAIEFTAANLGSSEVSKLEMTEIVNDEAGNYVREIRVYGPEPEIGGAAPVVITLKLVAPERASLQVTTPPLQV